MIPLHTLLLMHLSLVSAAYRVAFLGVGLQIDPLLWVKKLIGIIMVDGFSFPS